MADGELRNVLRRSCLNSTFWNSYRVLYSDGYGYKIIDRAHFLNCETAGTKYKMNVITILMVNVKKLKMSGWKLFSFWEKIQRKERKKQKLKMRIRFTVISLWLGLITLLSFVRSCYFYDLQIPNWSYDQPFKSWLWRFVSKLGDQRTHVPWFRSRSYWKCWFYL